MMCHKIGLPPISTIGFGRTAVSSLRRVPRPPANIMTFIAGRVQNGTDGDKQSGSSGCYRSLGITGPSARIRDKPVPGAVFIFREVWKLVVDRSPHLQLRFDERVRIEQDLDDDRPLIEQGWFQIVQVLDTAIAQPIGGRNQLKIRVAVADRRSVISATEIGILKLLDNPVTAVVHHDYRHFGAMLAEALQLVQAELEAAIPYEHDNLTLRSRELGPDRRRQCIPHRGIAACREYFVALAPEDLVQPADASTSIADDDRIFRHLG